MFNSADFMNLTFNDPIDTTRIPIPPGEYTAQVGSGEKDLSLDGGTSVQGNPWMRYDVNLTIADASGSVAQATGRNPAVIRMGVMLDLDASGKIDLSQGKNIRLGKFMEACGWPVDEKKRLTPGWSLRYPAGKVVKIKVSHEPNPKDPTQMFERVDAVTKTA